MLPLVAGTRRVTRAAEAEADGGGGKGVKQKQMVAEVKACGMRSSKVRGCLF